MTVAGHVLASLLLCVSILSLRASAAPVQPTWQEPVYNATNPLAVFDLPLDQLTGLVGNGTTFNIAVIMHCAGYGAGVTVPGAIDLVKLAYSTADDHDAHLKVLQSMKLNTEQVNNLCLNGIGFYNDFYRPFLLFQYRVNNQCNGGDLATVYPPPAVAPVGACGIPTSAFAPDGTQLRARVNFVYLNIGPLPVPSTPDEGYATLTYGNAALLSMLLSDPKYGYPAGYFPFIVPMVYGGEWATSTFSAACELTKKCLILNIFSSSPEFLTCIPQINQGDPSQSQEDVCPLDCQIKYGSSDSKKACRGQRRFDQTLSYLFDQDNVLTSLNTQMKLKGASTIAMIASGAPNAQYAADAAIADMGEKGLTLILHSLLGWVPAYKTAAGALIPAAPAPPLTGDDLAKLGDSVAALDPDVVMFHADTTQADNIQTFSNLVVYWKKIGWLPRAVVGGAGSFTQISQKIALATGIATDGGGIYGSTINDYRLRGRQYKTGSIPDPSSVLSQDNLNVNWEPWPNVEVTGQPIKYAAEVLRDDYIATFGDTTPVSMFQGSINPQIAATVCAMAGKLLEAAGTDDAALLLAASYRISIPSVGGLIQFENLGRLVAIDQPVVQLAPDGITFNLITPIDVGVADYYPLPTWQERVFTKTELSQPNEKLVTAINTLCIGFIILLASLVVVYRAHPVIKSSSSNQCVLSLVGAAICLSSNYCTSLTPTVSACAANVWLLTCGFTIMFGALLAKTWRLYRIFESGKLTMVKISDRTLFLVVLGALSVDILINIIWSGAAPFAIHTVMVDPLRIANNYIECDYTSTATALTYTQVAWKALLMLAALVLTIMVRNLPSTFNESSYMGGAIYNCSVLLCFVVPIVATGVGGRETTYLVRNFGVMVLVVSSMAIMFVPKLMLISSMTSTQANKATQMATAGGNTHHVTAISQPANSQMTPGVKDQDAPGSSEKQAFSNEKGKPDATIIRMQESRATAYSPGSPASPSRPSQVEGENIATLRQENIRLRAQLARYEQQEDHTIHPLLPGDVSDIS